ncbi:CDP-alcohol phosphatidyltransferase family protein [Afifella sp. JA880]|uniref:CDP-alcohol phosphatidyltransferase family protein n=1 Tax=Afifella sp. JA880 TaxID=2975280 RepID=UPI0021BB59DE|nr:CDP-alcohol phosphatidyltransferase family protein [Afifella sp. JA880]MCT8266456.1 CDP-alcohol phosphatidyltransferase family protein [Afifella sp. JA880]
MTLYDLKPAFQARLRPYVDRLAEKGVTANQVTLAASAISVLVGLLVMAAEVRPLFLLIPLWLGLRMAFNAADGMLAREHGQKSRLGAFFNELGDVVSDAFLYAPFAILPAFGPGLVAFVVLLAILTEFAGVLAQALGASRRYDGPLGKSDRALVFGVIGTWVGFGGPLPDWSALALWAVAILLVVTIVKRVRAALAEMPVRAGE